MMILKITTHWTPEEADCIYQLLDEFKTALWESYGDDIVEMRRAIQCEQRKVDVQRDVDDKLPF